MGLAGGKRGRGIKRSRCRILSESKASHLRALVLVERGTIDVLGFQSEWDSGFEADSGKQSDVISKQFRRGSLYTNGEGNANKWGDDDHPDPRGPRNAMKEEVGNRYYHMKRGLWCANAEEMEGVVRLLKNKISSWKYYLPCHGWLARHYCHRHGKVPWRHTNETFHGRNIVMRTSCWPRACT